MSDLAARQAQLVRALTTPGADPPAGFGSGDGNGLEATREVLVAKRVHALRRRLPLVEAALGEDRFAALAREFATSGPAAGSEAAWFCRWLALRVGPARMRSADAARIRVHTGRRGPRRLPAVARAGGGRVLVGWGWGGRRRDFVLARPRRRA